MKKVLRLLLLGYILCWCPTTMLAAPGKGENKTLLFLRNHVSIESGFSVLRVKPLTEYGQGNMSLLARPGMFVGFMYHVNLSNHFALRIGQIMGVNAFRFEFDPGKLNNPILTNRQARCFQVKKDQRPLQAQVAQCIVFHSLLWFLEPYHSPISFSHDHADHEPELIINRGR